MTKTCPDCGDDSLTITPAEGSILGHPIEDFVLAAENGDELRVTAFCWGCGYEVEKRLEVEVDE